MKLYFYKKTTQPEKYDYYNHTRGIVGLAEPIDRPCIFEGTVDDLNMILNKQNIKINHPHTYKSMMGGYH